MRYSSQDYASLAKEIADGVKWVVEYSKRHDDLYNVWSPVIEVHPDRSCSIYWEIVDVVSSEKEAKKAVAYQRRPR